MGKQIDFYTRAGCRLCEEALELLRELREEFEFELRVTDISCFPDLMALYKNDIPVAMLNGRKLFKHSTDKKSLRRMLRHHLLLS